MAHDVQLRDLQSRALNLYDSLLTDPDRPYWQVELTAIVLAHSEIMSLLSSDLISSGVDLTALKDKLTSLEHRYSELLYRMSERT